MTGSFNWELLFAMESQSNVMPAPLRNAPPWIQNITGTRLDLLTPTGLKILSVKQSSDCDRALNGSSASIIWKHACPYCVELMIPLLCAGAGGWSRKVPLGGWAYRMLRHDSTLNVELTSPIYVAPWLLTVGCARSERLWASGELDRLDTTCKRRGNKLNANNILPTDLREDVTVEERA